MSGAEIALFLNVVKIGRVLTFIIGMGFLCSPAAFALNQVCLDATRMLANHLPSKALDISYFDPLYTPELTMKKAETPEELRRLSDVIDQIIRSLIKDGQEARVFFKFFDLSIGSWEQYELLRTEPSLIVALKAKLTAYKAFRLKAWKQIQAAAERMPGFLSVYTHQPISFARIWNLQNVLEAGVQQILQEKSNPPTINPGAKKVAFDTNIYRSHGEWGDKLEGFQRSLRAKPGGYRHIILPEVVGEMGERLYLRRKEMDHFEFAFTEDVNKTDLQKMMMIAQTIADYRRLQQPKSASHIISDDIILAQVAMGGIDYFITLDTKMFDALTKNGDLVQSHSRLELNGELYHAVKVRVADPLGFRNFYEFTIVDALRKIQDPRRVDRIPSQTESARDTNTSTAPSSR